MNIEATAKTLDSQTSETLIVGIQKHREQMKNWSLFSEFYGETIDAWLQSGEISTDSKKLTKLPYAGAHSTLKRIIFVGLGEKKNITANDLREVFAMVGKEIGRAHV